MEANMTMSRASLATERLLRVFTMLGLTQLTPIVRLIRGEQPQEQFRRLLRDVGVPIISILIFFGLWAVVASRVKTSIGTVPGPAQVWYETKALWQGHLDERAKERDFYQRQTERRAAFLAANPGATLEWHKYTGKPTYIDQIITSLITVFTGFLLASVVAIPIGILCGLNKTFMAAFSPLIQVFKPVSPLAWLPIVVIMVSALYQSENPMFEKSFISSAIVVCLCSLWPTLINTALGVASINQDHLNVARVLQLNWFTRVTKIVIPSALPLIFTGLRLSLGVGWMVLIAAEMLAQNPGLGKFVWDMYQNGSSSTLAQIMVAVFTVGLIGCLLDRTMSILQRLVSFGEERQTS